MKTYFKDFIKGISTYKNMETLIFVVFFVCAFSHKENLTDNLIRYGIIYFIILFVTWNILYFKHKNKNENV